MLGTWFGSSTEPPPRDLILLEFLAYINRFNQMDRSTGQLSPFEASKSLYSTPKHPPCHQQPEVGCRRLVIVTSSSLMSLAPAHDHWNPSAVLSTSTREPTLNFAMALAWIQNIISCDIPLALSPAPSEAPRNPRCCHLIRWPQAPRLKTRTPPPSALYATSDG